MIRKFRFEDEIYASLSCLPMAARRNLDMLGIKIHRAQWERLGRGEKLMICHAPSSNEEEREALRTFIVEAIASRTGSAPHELPDEARRSAAPPAQVPPILVRNASAKGFELDDEAWAMMDDDQRYALMKLGGSDKPRPKFAAALTEFLPRATHESA